MKLDGGPVVRRQARRSTGRPRAGVLSAVPRPVASANESGTGTAGRGAAENVHLLSRAPSPARRRRPRIVLGIADVALHQQVLDFLQRNPALDIAGSATDVASVLDRIGRTSPDVVVACPHMARELGHPAVHKTVPRLLIVAEDVTIPLLRQAIEGRAHGVFAWPQERDELSYATTSAALATASTSSRRGAVVAIAGARGGVGTTFVAVNLAAALSGLGATAALVDVASDAGDVAVALRAGEAGERRSVSDLVAVADELAPEHLEHALVRHPRGFAALLGPADGTSAVPPSLHADCSALLATAYRSVLLHVPRVGDSAKRAVASADRVLLVCDEDLYSLDGAYRFLSALSLVDDPRVDVVVNRRARRHGVVRADAFERFLGRRPFAQIRFDRRAARAHGAAQLLRSRSRGAARDIRALAERLLRDDSSGLASTGVAP